MPKLPIFAVLTALAAASCTPAHAQDKICQPTADMLTALETAGSYPVGAGIDKDGLLVQVFVNPVRHLWGIYTTDVEGTMCFQVGGQGWYTSTIPLPGEVA